MNRATSLGTWLGLALLLVAPAAGAGPVRISSSSTAAENEVRLAKPIKAKRFPKLTVSWVFAPEHDQIGDGLEPSVFFCDVQLFKKDGFVNGVDVTFDIKLIHGSEVVQSVRLTDTTTSFAQASFQLDREDFEVTEISHAQVSSTLKGSLRVDEVSLECTSRSKP